MPRRKGKKPATSGQASVNAVVQNGVPSSSNAVSMPIPSSTKPKNSKKKKGGSKKIIGKTVGNFKCTNENCGRTWRSMHAWTSERFLCEVCEAKSKVLKFVDEECTLDCYKCSSCGETWQSIHDSGTIAQECFCGQMVVKNRGTQKRFGRHYFYQCLNRQECGIEWEDFYHGKEYSQRCTLCWSAGVMNSVSQVSQNSRPGNGKRGLFGGAGGSHNIDGCDMCQALVRQGIARSCTRNNRVVISVEYDHDGTITEKVVEAR